MNGIEIIEKKSYNLEGEVIKISYSIVTPDEFGYLRRFKSYGEARQFIIENYGI